MLQHSPVECPDLIKVEWEADGEATDAHQYVFYGLPHYRGFKITLRHTILGRTSLDERSALCRDLYVTKKHLSPRLEFF